MKSHHPKRRPTPRRGSVLPPEVLKARGLRSRDRLKQAARDVLNERGYRFMRVQDVAARAGLAAGLFYRYFHDLREIVAEIARDFFAEILARAAPARSLQGFEWIRVVLIDAVRQFAANPGILACLFGLAGDYEEFDQIWKKNAHKWNLQVAAFLVRDAGLPHAQANRMGFMLGAMTEGVIYQALIRRTNDIARFAAKPENVAEVLAVMWYRAIYLSEPPKAKLGPAGRAFIVAASTRRKPRSK